MWLPGHFAAAFIICFPLIVLAKKEDRALAIAFVAFFSLLPDLLHLGSLRMISHSFIGLAIMLAMTLGPTWYLFRPRKLLLAIGAVAAASHLLVDLYVGSVTLYYPFSANSLSMHPFNLTFDIIVEVVLLIATFGAILVLLRPLDMLRSVSTYPKTKRVNLILLMAPFTLLSALEGGYYFLYSFRPAVGLFRGALLLDFVLLFLGSVLLVMIALAASPIVRPLWNSVRGE